MFRPGQYVAVKVLEVGAKNLMLSMMPQHVNAGRLHSELHKGITVINNLQLVCVAYRVILGETISLFNAFKTSKFIGSKQDFIYIMKCCIFC